MNIIKILIGVYILFALFIVNSMAFDPSMFDDEEFELERQNTRFDPSMFDDEEFELERQNTRFDPSMFQEPDFVTPPSPPIDDVPSESAEFLVQGSENQEQIQTSEISSDSILLLAGYGIIVITLAGIVILYAIHFFRRKRGEHN